MNSMEIKVTIYLRLNTLVLCNGRKKDLSRFFLVGYRLNRTLSYYYQHYGCHDDHKIN